MQTYAEGNEAEAIRMFFKIVQRKGEPEIEMGHQCEKEVGMGNVLSL